MEREREQLVISLGEGLDGQKLRESLDMAAKRAGRPTSTWAREVLAAAASILESPGEPIIDVIAHRDGSRLHMSIDLRSIVAMEGGERLGGSGRTNQVRCLLAGEWWTIEATNPLEFIRSWKRASNPPQQSSAWVVDAWQAKAGDDAGARRIVNDPFPPPHRLRLVGDPTADSLVASVYIHDGRGGYVGPASTTGLRDIPWYVDMEENRVLIRGSGIWRVTNVLDVQRPAGPDSAVRTIATVFLKFEKAIR